MFVFVLMLALSFRQPAEEAEALNVLGAIDAEEVKASIR
jgi:hypothetical protein